MKSFSLDTPTGSIALLEWGDPNGTPVLCLHGWLDNAFSFYPLAKVLEKYPIRLLAMDFPGHGHSAHKPVGSLYHFIEFVSTIHFVVESLGWKKWNLIGHSMGGGLGSLYAGTFPGSLERLVLIEALGPVSREAEAAPAYLEKAIVKHSQYFAPQRKKTDTQSLELDEWIKLRLRAGDMNESSARLLMERGTESMEGSSYRLRRDPRLNLPSFLRLTEDHVLEFLKRIRATTTFIRATNGYKWEGSFLENRIKAISKLEEVVLEGNHHLHMDNPEMVGKVILDSLGLG